MGYSSDEMWTILQRHQEEFERDWRFAVIAALLCGLIFGWIGHSVFNLVMGAIS